MKITYDPEADALYIRFKEAQVRTEHWSESVAADYDADGHLCGIEILDASAQFADLKALKTVDFRQYETTRRD